MEITFNPEVKLVGNIKPTYSIQELDNEIGVFSLSPSFVKTHCGPIANSILDKIPKSFFDKCSQLNLYPNIDIRIHRLYPNDYPAFPGWHTDGELRENYYSQPDLTQIPLHDHIICSVSTDSDGVSNTELVLDKVTVPIINPSSENTLWNQVHTFIESKSVSTKLVNDGEIVQFNSFTLHRATPAKVRGWRLFFRLSMWHKPYLGNGGKISKQEQVYRVKEGGGW